MVFWMKAAARQAGRRAQTLLGGWTEGIRARLRLMAGAGKVALHRVMMTPHAMPAGQYARAMSSEPESKTEQAHNWTFFRQWLKNPLRVAAISPSSPQLARQMMLEVQKSARRVIELGGGTGVFTQALLDHGIAPANLLVIELNEELHQHLQKRFPAVQVACADARDLAELARDRGFVGDERADVIISGLGLLSMPKPTQLAIMSAAMATLKPDGRFVQFTYGPANPVAREVLDQLGLNARRSSFTWWNVPPATVYVYTRRLSRGITPRSMR